MSFDEGMRLFRSGDVPGACEQFHLAVEQNENNHKAWNALGICLSKTGKYEDADISFENALMLDPGNATYMKNQEKNDQKRPVNWQVKEPGKTQAKAKTTGNKYQPNWFLIVLFFIPCVLCAINIGIGFIALIGGLWYMKKDADTLNAGINPNGRFWSKFKSWEWVVFALLFWWVALPVYVWFREQIYEDNNEYPGKSSHTSDASGQAIWRSVKILGGVLIGFFIFILFVSVFLGSSHNGHGVAYAVGEKSGQDIGEVYLGVKQIAFQATPRITVIPTQELKKILGDNDFYYNTAKLFAKISSNSFKSSNALDIRDYITVGELTDSNIVAIDTYNLKWDLYELSPKARGTSDEVKVLLDKYRTVLVNINLAISAHNSGNYVLEDKYFGDALPDMLDAITRMSSISQKLS